MHTDPVERNIHPRWQKHPHRIRYRKSAILLWACSLLLMVGFLYILRSPFVQPDLQLVSIGQHSTSERNVSGDWIEVDCEGSIEAWTKQIESQIHYKHPLFVCWHGSLSIDPEEPGLKKLKDKSHSQSTGKSIREVLSHLRRMSCREIVLVVDAVSPSRNGLEQLASVACEDVIRDLIEDELSEVMATPMAVLVNVSDAQDASELCGTSKLVYEFHNQLADIAESTSFSTSDLISLVEHVSSSTKRRSLPWVFSPHWPLDPRLIQMRPKMKRLETVVDSTREIAASPPSHGAEDQIAPKKQPMNGSESANQSSSFCAVIERILIARGQMKETQQRNEVQSTLLELESRLRNHSTIDDWKLWHSKQSKAWLATWEGEWLAQWLDHPSNDTELFQTLATNRLKSAQLAIDQDAVLWVEDWYRQAEDLRLSSERCWNDRVHPNWQQQSMTKARSASKLYGQCQSTLAKVAVERERFERFTHLQAAGAEADAGADCEEIHDVARWKSWIELLHDKSVSNSSTAMVKNKCESRRECLASIHPTGTMDLRPTGTRIYPVGYRAPSSLMHKNDVVSNRLMRVGFSWYASHIGRYPELASDVFEGFEKSADKLVGESISSAFAVREILELEKWIELQWQRACQAKEESRDSQSGPWLMNSSVSQDTESLIQSLRERHRQSLRGANCLERNELTRVDQWLAAVLDYQPTSIPTLTLDVPAQLDWAPRNTIQFAVAVKGVTAGIPIQCSIEVDDPKHRVMLDGTTMKQLQSVTFPTRSDIRNIPCEVRVADEESRNPRPFRMVLHVSQGDMHSRASIDFGGTSTHMASVRIGPGDMRLGSESQSSYGNGTDTRSSLPGEAIWRCMPNRIQSGVVYFRNRLPHTEAFSFRLLSVEEMPDSVPIGARDATVIDRWLANAPKLQLLATAVASALPAGSERQLSWKSAGPPPSNTPTRVGGMMIEASSSTGNTKELIPCYLERIAPRTRVVPSVTLDADRGLIAIRVQRRLDAEGAACSCRIDGILRDQADGTPVSSGKVELQPHDSLTMMNLSIANCRSGHPILELQIDGQPASFVYRIPRNRSGFIEESNSCLGVMVGIKPTMRIPLWSESRIEAVCAALVSDGMWDRDRDQLWIGIDRNGDRIMDRDHQYPVSNPISMRIDWRGVDAEGNLLIETNLEMPQISIPMDTRWNQSASLVAMFQRPGDAPLYSNECPVILDREPPAVSHAWPSNVSSHPLLGPPVAMEVEVFDSLSPIVWVGGGWSNNGQVDFVDGMEILPAIRQTNGRWSLTLPTEKQCTGHNVLLIQAKDAAGNVSETHRMNVELRTAKELEAIEATKTTLVATRVLFGKVPLENMRVKLYAVAAVPEKAAVPENGSAVSTMQPSYEGTTNPTGDCRIESVRKGKYKLEASGSVKGNRQVRSMIIDVDASKPWETYTFRFDLKGQ